MENLYSTPESEVANTASQSGDLRPKAKSIFKLNFIGFFASLGPLLFINGLYDLVTGSESIITVNGEKLIGISGFIGTLIFIPIVSLALAAMNWCFMAFGIWLYTRFKNLNLEFHETA